ncbi:apolipoprotein N-acyltransferase [Porticoccus sp. W117]|uniref:apolipoprotein N-acyltransferase n=1 Tax=Porticoccus sp. W117 TaxID=3054777 RepID=UPI0025914078|nr:apolipoprotein N-acyltransferase [Porticoccus sp. W117]MDM3872481.1 apolipoprotein N-acyltransferase [Porticoccus sp. W117]
MTAVKNAMAKQTTLHRIALPLAGALLPLSLAPFFLWPLGIFSAGVLAYLLPGRTIKASYWHSVLYCLGVFAVGASWVFNSINVYSSTPLAAALLLTALFVIVLALFFSLPFALLGLVKRSAAAQLLAFPALWVVAEWFIGWILTGFPWVYLGYGHVHSWLAGWAPLGGVWSISWIVAFCGATAASLLQQRSRSSIVAVSVCLLLWLAGLGLKQATWTTPQKPLSIGVLQPNIPQNDRWQISYRDRIISNNLSLGEQLWDNQLVIWPEAAIPELQHRVMPLIRQLDQLARQTDTAFITGIPVYNFADDEFYNSVIALGKASGEYRKQHLVPFGEYVPLATLLRKLGGFFDLPMSGFTPGTDDQPLITAGDHKIATAICYEIAYQNLVRKLSPDASLILTVSNDTWFGDTLAPHQHLSMAQMRALENGKPVIRATNDGITALINHKGEIFEKLPQFQEGILQSSVTPHTGTTPYNRFGHWPMLLFVGLCLGVCFWVSRKRHSQG